MTSNEGFKDYAQKWRDLAGRVQPPLSERELVDMLLGTLSGPFFNHLIGSSSVGFTDLTLTGERVESGIRSGKIQKDASASTAMRKPFIGKKEVSVVYPQRNQGRAMPTNGRICYGKIFLMLIQSKAFSGSVRSTLRSP